MLDVKYTQFFTNLIRKIVKQELSQLNINPMYPGTVVAVNGNLADVKLAGDDVSILTGLKNKSGETLSVGNQCYVIAINNNLSNACILIKK